MRTVAWGIVLLSLSCAARTPRAAAPADATLPDGTALAGAGELEPPRLVSGPGPRYTAEAIARRAEGEIRAACVVGLDGSVDDCRIVSSTVPLMERAAIEALEHRVYEPARLHGKPVAVRYHFRLTFRMPEPR